MNHEFAFKATPGLARRLIKMSSLCRITVDDHIRQLATQDLITPEQIAQLRLSPVQASAVQKVLDMDMRAVLVTAEFDVSRVTALSAAKLHSARPIVVATPYIHRWKALAEGKGFTATHDPNDNAEVLVVEPNRLISKEVIENRREGILIAESKSDTIWQPEWDALYQGPAREFKHTLAVCNLSPIFDNYGGWTQHADAAIGSAGRILFNDFPLMAVSSAKEERSKTFYALKSRGYKYLKPRDLFVMFNIVTDLLGDREPK